jgi:hypothetical protein
MTQDEIIEMARQAGFEIGSVTNAIYAPTSCEFELKVFAKLVAAAEREACAKVCHEVYTKWVCESDEDVNYPDPNDCIRAIRARGSQMKRPIESDYISQVAYTRALEAYCDRQDRIRRAEEAFEASQQIIQSYLGKDNSDEDLYNLAVKADNGGQP